MEHFKNGHLEASRDIRRRGGAQFIDVAVIDNRRAKINGHQYVAVTNLSRYGDNKMLLTRYRSSRMPPIVNPIRVGLQAGMKIYKTDLAERSNTLSCLPRGKYVFCPMVMSRGDGT